MPTGLKLCGKPLVTGDTCQRPIPVEDNGCWAHDPARVAARKEAMDRPPGWGKKWRKPK